MLKLHEQRAVKKKYLTPLVFCSKIRKAGKIMDKIYEQTMLFDFYGELLTEHQRCIYADAVYNDLSLGEIAEEYGITRQGVHDLIRRCDRILRGYEDRLHLVESFAKAKKTLEEIEQLTILPENTNALPAGEKLDSEGIRSRLSAIRELSHTLRNEL